jgi:hypothetical protein
MALAQKLTAEVFARYTFHEKSGNEMNKFFKEDKYESTRFYTCDDAARGIAGGVADVVVRETAGGIK